MLFGSCLLFFYLESRNMPRIAGRVQAKAPQGPRFGYGAEPYNGGHARTLGGIKQNVTSRVTSRRSRRDGLGHRHVFRAPAPSAQENEWSAVVDMGGQLKLLRIQIAIKAPACWMTSNFARRRPSCSCGASVCLGSRVPQELGDPPGVRGRKRGFSSATL